MKKIRQYQFMAEWWNYHLLKRVKRIKIFDMSKDDLQMERIFAASYRSM